MKIGIVTLTRNPNYGNILQNLALQLFLTKLGYEPETIINYQGSSLFIKKFSFKNVIRIIINRNNAKLLEKRRRVFLDCCYKHIKYSKYEYYNNSISPEVINCYDYFIAGSDQLWNPYFGAATDFEFLKFAKPEQRISYAASIGVDEIEDRHKEKFVNAFEGFKRISLREKSGAEIVKMYSNLECDVNIDPTILISAEEWRNIYCKPSKIIDGKYIAVYMLGDMSDELNSSIQNFAEFNNLHVYYLSDYDILSPLEFIWIIDHAEYVFTDSFHGTVFSILFGKKFLVLERNDKEKNQMTRFDNLFSLFNIEQKITSTVVENQIVYPETNKIKLVQNKEIERSIKYFKQLIK